MSDTKLENNCLCGWVWCVKYGEMNGSMHHVHKYRVTELIIAIRVFLYSKEEDKAKQREKILSRWKQLCSIPEGQQHIRLHALLADFFLHKNCNTASLSLVRFMILPFSQSAPLLKQTLFS